jgi:hypothetical protein
VTRFTKEESKKFVRRGLGLSYIACQTRGDDQKKKVPPPGEVEPESRRRDDDA